MLDGCGVTRKVGERSGTRRVLRRTLRGLPKASEYRPHDVRITDPDRVIAGLLDERDDSFRTGDCSEFNGFRNCLTRRLAPGRQFARQIFACHIGSEAAEFPDDPPRERFYARDYLAPRFLPWIVHKYTMALRKQDDSALAVALADLAFVRHLLKINVRTIIGVLLPLMRQPRLVRPLLPWFSVMRPLLRRLLR
jgi:hypothetical protein